MKRVAVTGIGVLSPLGNDCHAVFDAARCGRSAVARLSGLSGVAGVAAERLQAPLAATVQFDAAAHFEPAKARMLDRVSQLAVVAARCATADAGLDLRAIDAERAGVFVGISMGGTLSMDDGYRRLYEDGSDRVKPLMILLGMHNAPAAWVGIESGFRGPNLTYSTACSSSAVAIGEAWLRVASGHIDVAMAGGTEAPLSLGSLKAWEALHTLATVDDEMPQASCKPFSANRSGMVLGEGAAMLVLEPWDHAVARGARIHGEVMGYGVVNDASHIARPSVEGQAAAMQAALASAQLAPGRIDSINAHGTGTLVNDVAETAAIKQVFGTRAARIPVSATKALHGHLLGAAGALECVLSLLAMQRETALPTMHLQVPDPLCDLDYVANQARAGASGQIMLSNSFAFGGTNAVLVLGAGPGAGPGQFL